MLAIALTVVSCLTLAAQAAPASGPTVFLDRGKFIGVEKGPNGQFLGIPFAQPASGNGRFHLPPVLGGASTVAPGPMSEDCLTINVVTPANATLKSKLPVAVWIYGGGFETGASSEYDGGVIVNRSLELGEPVVYVSMNYRLSGFGFLASKEVKSAGVRNLGLHDQREAFRWVQKYIHAFGGDPTKVTIWGESAGAISVGLHLVTNGGNPDGLFRGAAVYDMIVEETGCTGSRDTLECLRTVPSETLFGIFNATATVFDPTQALNGTWEPRIDGQIFPEGGETLVAKGAIANVPMINSDCDDEGTLFSVALSNITTDTDVAAFLQRNYFPKATAAQLNQLLDLYPEDPTAGSPFDTGTQNVLFPQFKRLAALQGDITFQGPRRFLFNNRADKQPIFSFVFKRVKSTPILGSLHGSDNMYGGEELTDFLIHFVNHLDPNGPLVSGEVINWPRYTLEERQLLTLNDAPAAPLTITTDDFRADAIEFVTQLTMASLNE